MFKKRQIILVGGLMLAVNVWAADDDFTAAAGDQPEPDGSYIGSPLALQPFEPIIGPDEILLSQLVRMKPARTGASIVNGHHVGPKKTPQAPWFQRWWRSHFGKVSEEQGAPETKSETEVTDLSNHESITTGAAATPEMIQSSETVEELAQNQEELSGGNSDEAAATSAANAEAERVEL